MSKYVESLFLTGFLRQSCHIAFMSGIMMHTIILDLLVIVMFSTPATALLSL